MDYFMVGAVTHPYDIQTAVGCVGGDALEVVIYFGGGFIGGLDPVDTGLVTGSGHGDADIGKHTETGGVAYGCKVGRSADNRAYEAMIADGIAKAGHLYHA